jgi:hypothetical protein
MWPLYIMMGFKGNTIHLFKQMRIPTYWHILELGMMGLSKPLQFLQRVLPITQIQKFDHDNVFGQYNSLVNITGGSDSYLLAYGGPNTNEQDDYDGFIKTFSIPVYGTTIT